MVFKKLTDRLHSASTAAANAVSNALAPSEQYTNEIRQLESMGFMSERARHALNATNGNVDRAAELLLLSVEGEDDDDGDTTSRSQDQQPQNVNLHGGGGGTVVAGGEGPAVTARNDEQMKRAIEESLQSLSSSSQQQQQQQQQREVIDLTIDEGNTKKQTKQKKKIQSSSSSNSNNSNSTALRDTAHVRAKKAPLSQTHPTIQLPDKLTNKSKEEQILRLVNRILITTTTTSQQHSSLNNNVMSIDTLHRTLVAVRSHPSESKYRTIDRNNINYTNYIKNVPGAEELLKVMNYQLLLKEDVLQLDYQFVDDALLYLGITALEMARTRQEYIIGKQLYNFQKEMIRIGSTTNSVTMTENDTLIRLNYMSICPREPKEGGTRIDVYLGNSTNETECNDYGLHVHRRFDGDDTLEDILNWLGGCYGSELLDKLQGGIGDSSGGRGLWCLCDLNTVPSPTPLDVVKHRRKTLQYLGLFPSGKLGIRLSDDSWKDGYELDSNISSSSARGLGAASRSMLY